MADHEDTVTLELLQAIEQRHFESQRQFAARLGIAVGLANSYIKRCITKGWIKMSRTPARRYAYFITPKGFSEKSRLTARYLGDSFKLYRIARREFLAAFRTCQARGWRRLALFGADDLTEIAALSAREVGCTALAVVAPESRRERLLDLRVSARLDDLRTQDAVLLATMTNPQEAYRRLSGYVPPERIVTIPLLRIARHDTAAQLPPDRGPVAERSA